MESNDLQGIAYRDMREYIALLESKGLVAHVRTEVDLKWELGAITARSLDRGGPALLFDNIRGYEGHTFVTNLLSTTEQVAIAFTI